MNLASHFREKADSCQKKRLLWVPTHLCACLVIHPSFYPNPALDHVPDPSTINCSKTYTSLSLSLSPFQIVTISYLSELKNLSPPVLPSYHVSAPLYSKTEQHNEHGSPSPLCWYELSPHWLAVLALFCVNDPNQSP